MFVYIRPRATLVTQLRDRVQLEDRHEIHKLKVVSKDTRQGNYIQRPCERPMKYKDQVYMR